MAIVLSPLSHRRLGALRVSRRGRLALWLLSALLVACLFAELIANDRPLLLEYRGQWFLPVLWDYPGTVFGGELPFPPDCRGRFMSERITYDGWALQPPTRFDAHSISYARPTSAPPSAENWPGTDDQGHDALARVIYGLRLSILLALGLTLVSSLLGICAGAMQGCYGGQIDLFGRRLIKVWSDLPMLYLLIILINLVQPGVGWLLAIMLLFSWTSLVDVVCIEFLRGRHLEYVKAAWTLGLGDAGMMLRHILPNAMVATPTLLSFLSCGTVITLTALDFLGFGLSPDSPGLGELIEQGRDNLQTLWFGLTAFMVLTTLLNPLVLTGETVHGVFDPRK